MITVVNFLNHTARIRVVHHTRLNGLQFVVGLSLYTRRLHESKEDVEPDLELAVAHLGKTQIVVG